MGIMFLTIEKVYKMPILRKYQYSNTIKVMMFFSNIKSYVPIKLCKTSGSIHFFKLMGSIRREDVTIHRNTNMGYIRYRLAKYYSNIKRKHN